MPLVEEETGGRFRVWLLSAKEGSAQTETHLLWDRKTKGGFPELKELVSDLNSLLLRRRSANLCVHGRLQKQIIRDKIAPQRNLGHSDKGGKASHE